MISAQAHSKRTPSSSSAAGSLELLIFDPGFQAEFKRETMQAPWRRLSAHLLLGRVHEKKKDMKKANRGAIEHDV